MAGGLLAQSDKEQADGDRDGTALRSAQWWSQWFLTPVATVIALICGYFAISAPHPPAGVTLSDLLANDRALYNLSLGHLSDLTGSAMSFFRRPLAAVALGMLALGPVSMLLRRKNHTYAANLTLATGMTVTLLAAHTGLVRFYPILGSKELATTINRVIKPTDLIGRRQRSDLRLNPDLLYRPPGSRGQWPL